jgi:hypothetical protein
MRRCKMLRTCGNTWQKYLRRNKEKGEPVDCEILERTYKTQPSIQFDSIKTGCNGFFDFFT